jgi:prenyltransferase beta subunit
MRVEDGYLDTPGGSAPQTSATAAAAGVLLMAGERPDVAPFLLHMQAKDGGFLAHPAAPHSDLLSTYSAYLTLVLLGEEDAVDHGALGRFLRSTALAEGGFRSCPLDPEADVEYTFYGVAAIALLKARSA